MKRIYLDNNGSTALDPRVCHSLAKILQDLQGNPSSTHFFGRQTLGAVGKARDSIASYLGVKPHELIFTSGGTEGANMVLKGISSQKKKGHIITSTVEHSCVFATIQALEKNDYRVTYLSPGLIGSVSADAVHEAICQETQLIAIMAVNNETGVKSDIAGIAEVAKQHNVPLFIDGVALLGKEPFTIPSGVSAMTFSGHKLHAPKGIGMTFIRSNFKLDPLLTGGEQEFGKRGGTQNVLGIIGLATAVELLSTELPEASLRMQSLRNLFESLLMENLDRISINGTGPRIANTSNLAFSGVDGEALLIALDAAGVAASHGSACASGSTEPSRILLEMGLPLDLVLSSIRFSLSRFTTEEEIRTASTIIIDAVRRMRHVNRSIR